MGERLSERRNRNRALIPFNAATSGRCSHLQHRVQRVPRVRPDHQRGVGAALLDQASQVFAPDLLAGVVDVVTVADYGDGHVGELLDDVLEGVFFVVFAPSRDGAEGDGGEKEELFWSRLRSSFYMLFFFK